MTSRTMALPAAGLLFAAGISLGVTGCASDSHKAEAGVARTGNDPTLTPRHDASQLYTPPDRATARGDERISRAQPASSRSANAGELEMNVFSMTLPGDGEMLLLEGRGPMEVRSGEPFEYEIDVTNTSDRPLANIIIAEHTSDNLEFLAADPESLEAGDEVDRSWTIAHLKPGETETILINAEAMEAGHAGLCLTASMTPLICLATEVVEPEIEITRTGPSEILRCEPIEYIITVRNTGVGAARNVRITDELPAGLIREGEQLVEIDVGTLEAGQSREVPIVVEATSIGEFTTTARVTAEGGISQTADYTVAVHEPRLEITTSGPTRDYIGAPLDYEITVTNVGDAAARDTVLTESMPRGAEFERATLDGRAAGDRVTWSLGTLNPGESKTVSVRMRVDREGQFTNTATATAYCANDVRAEVHTTLTGIAGLLIEVVDTEDPVRIGEETTYEITVTNQGTTVANIVQIKAALDPNVELVSATGETSHRATGTDELVFEPVESLKAGQSATWRVTVRGLSPADSRFNVEMTSSELEEPVEEEESTKVYEGG